ncbi:MAG: glutathione S-transferase family protein [Pseudomonadota bacterium]
MSDINPITLHYFYGRGIGESIRLILTIGEISFVDKRYSFDEYAANNDLKSKSPFGQIPCLQVGDRYFGQTDSISRYAANLAGLYPDDAMEAARCDMIVVQLADIQSALAKMIYDGVPGAPGTKQFPPEEKAKRIGQWMDEKLPDILQRLENLAHDSAFLASGLSWADIALFCRVIHLMETQAGWELNGYPKLEKIFGSVANHERVKSWIAEHPDDYEHYEA